MRRRLPGESAWTFIGVSGKKEFVDNTLVAGPDSVQYTVQGQRSDQSGPLSEIFAVNFGQAPGGGSTASVMAAHGLETRATDAALLQVNGTPTISTVNGHAVQKVLPSGSGTGKRGTTRV